jgi:hypothetical protein
LCRKPIPQAKDVYALDAEWQRRFPDMLGILACGRCAVNTCPWSCHERGGTVVAGHRPAEGKNGYCNDSYDHILDRGTHVAMVLAYPQAGLLQGAEAYLRWVVRRPGADAESVGRIRAALEQWDPEHGSDQVASYGAALGRSTGRVACDACDPAALAPYDQPYDHVHWEQALPRNLRTDGCVRRRGYAVGMAGAIRQTWVFFADLEPALVFGRAGRMSSVDIRSYGVYPAAHEVKFNDQDNRDVRTLYLHHDSIDRQPDEQQVFQRWLAGTVASSSHFQPPRASGRDQRVHRPQHVPKRSTRDGTADG